MPHLVFFSFLYLIATTFPAAGPALKISWKNTQHKEQMVQIGICSFWDQHGHFDPQWEPGRFYERMEFWCGRRI